MTITIAVDCDGVLADFLGGYIRSVHRLTGELLPREEIDSYYIERTAAFARIQQAHAETHPDLHRDVVDRICSRWWCHDLQPLPGAREGLDALRAAGHRVVCVTSPWFSSPYWQYERHHWLARHMAFAPGDVIQTSAKQFVAADILIDDHPDHVRKWQKRIGQVMPLAAGVIWDATYNRDAVDLPRTRSWQWLLEMTR